MKFFMAQPMLPLLEMRCSNLVGANGGLQGGADRVSPCLHCTLMGLVLKAQPVTRQVWSIGFF
jgi:hypothetical protein